MKMFSKLGLLALVAPLVSGLSITIPPTINSAGGITITWTVASGDPDTFSIELTNAAFNDAFAIANNVDASTLSTTLTLPAVPPGSGYTIEFVAISNINQVFASTPSFSIGAPVTTSNSGSTASTTTSGTGTTTDTTTGTTTGATTSTQSGITTTANSLPVTSSVSTTSGSSSSTGTTTSATPSTAAAVSRLALTNAGGYAALLLSAVAGAVAVAL